MPYLGTVPTTTFQTLAKQDFTTSATTSYTLSQSVSSANDIALFINNVRQEPTYAYSASGTALTLTAATTSSDDMYCVYLGKAVGTVNPASGSVGLGELSATGTKDATTFLRGDNTFATPSGGAYETALLHVVNQQATNTNGGGTTASSFVKIPFNTVKTNEITGASLSSSQITLPSGTYYLSAQTPLYRTNEFKMILRNTTDSTYDLFGNGGTANQTYAVNTFASIDGRFTISAQKVFEIQMWTQRTQTNGFGYGVGITDGQATIFASAKIWKVA
jgi:hypothetical protein